MTDIWTWHDWAWESWCNSAWSININRKCKIKMQCKNTQTSMQGRKQKGEYPEHKNLRQIWQATIAPEKNTPTWKCKTFASGARTTCLPSNQGSVFTQPQWPQMVPFCRIKGSIKDDIVLPRCYYQLSPAILVAMINLHHNRLPRDD